MEVTGRQAMDWRAEWEATADPDPKERLLAYNREDCASLAGEMAIPSGLAADADHAPFRRPGCRRWDR